MMKEEKSRGQRFCPDWGKNPSLPVLSQLLFPLGNSNPCCINTYMNMFSLTDCFSILFCYLFTCCIWCIIVKKIIKTIFFDVNTSKIGRKSILIRKQKTLLINGNLTGSTWPQKQLKKLKFPINAFILNEMIGNEWDSILS